MRTCRARDVRIAPALHAIAASAVCVLGTPGPSRACSPNECAVRAFAPESGATIPQNAPALVWRPTQTRSDQPVLPAPYLEHLPLEEVTLAEVLRDAGYKTFFAGKWHLGGPGFYPEDQGFDVNVGGHERGSPPGGYFAPYKNPKLPDGPDGEHLPDRLARETASFIEANRDVPFLAYLSFYSVHTPLQGRADLVAKYEARRDPNITEDQRWGTEGDRKVRLIQDHATYAAMVEAMDAAVGAVLDALDRAGIADRTIVVFTSDNGGLSTSEGHPTSNLPLRAGKGWLYEGGIREPLILRGPGISPGGKTIDVPAISTDFLPTLLDFAHLDPPAGKNLDGVSLAPLLKGDPIAPRPLFWHYPHYGNQGGAPSAAIRSGDFKLIEFFEDNHVELYDLQSDIGEQHDISKADPHQTATLRDSLRAWQGRIGAEFPSPNTK